MTTIYKLPESLPEDLERFRAETERFKRGETSAVEYRAFRVPQGVYEERAQGSFMLRVRLPAGVLLPHQMRVLAAVSRRYGKDVLHVTSRQDIQVHGVPLDGIHPALVQLCGAGLSTKGGGGNTVRNITSCSHAGVCAQEAFDVTPYVVALTEALIGDPRSYQLPRKYKIAFSGCSRDCAGAAVNDLGFIAKVRGGEPGFAVYVAGGMGAHSRVADRLEDFVPAGEVYLVAEAVKRVFDKHGNRKNRHRARLRFLVESIGLERFRGLYAAEAAELRKAGAGPLQVRPVPAAEVRATSATEPAAEGFGAWRQANVEPQKQAGRFLVHVPLMLGDISADALEGLADVVERHGEGMARATQWQNLVLRWVRDDELASLHRALAALRLAEPLAPILRDTVTCTGAATCKLGICLSRGLACAVADGLLRSGIELDRLGALAVHISGCPNACGRHPIGPIGLSGAARRFGGRLVPHYAVQLGGRLGEGRTRLGQEVGSVPARNVPAFMVEFLRAFQRSPLFPDYEAFLEDGGREAAEQLVAGHKDVPSFEEDKDCYYDWGAEVPFSLAGRGPGECGAGVLDLIEVDLASAREALGKGRLYAACVAAARALLVTQGHEARDDAEALRLFTASFMDTGLVHEPFRPLVVRALSAAGRAEEFEAEPLHVRTFVEAVQGLYDGMDSSLRFGPVRAPGSAPAKEAGGEVRIAREADFASVTCPVNYAKTTMLLDEVGTGDVVSVLLDEAGARNVPGSVEEDGHRVLSVTQEGSCWRVLIRKG